MLLAAYLFALAMMAPVCLQAAPTQLITQPTASADAPQPAWMEELAKRHEALVKKNGPGTDAALHDRLLAMYAEDQAAPERGLTKVDPKDADAYKAALNLHATDTRLTDELKQIVAEHGWPTIALVGYEASNGAMAILVHTRDHAWQLSLLEQLEELADAGKIDGSALAVAVDKELVSEGKLQRYGSQFKFVDSGVAMFGVEDPSTLDARRAKVFLPPMGAYREMLGSMYHVKVLDKIVSAAK